MPEYPKVSVAFTTCKRLSLFYNTVDSFLQCCDDLDLIDSFLIVDDNSTQADQKTMVAMFDDISGELNIDSKLIAKPLYLKGHPQSLNIILADANEKYHVHIEDDMSFCNKGHFIREAIDVMEERKDIAQVLFKNCEDRFEPSYVASGKKYFEWPFTPENNYPGFSLNNGLWNMEIVKSLGRFATDKPAFELDFANRYLAAGYKVGLLDKQYYQHDGAGYSSYDLNGTPR